MVRSLFNLELGRKNAGVQLYILDVGMVWARCGQRVGNVWAVYGQDADVTCAGCCRNVRRMCAGFLHDVVRVRG